MADPYRKERAELLVGIQRQSAERLGLGTLLHLCLPPRKWARFWARVRVGHLWACDCARIWRWNGREWRQTDADDK